MVLARASLEGQFADTQLLHYLDPYGDAVFNRAQSGVLHTDVRQQVQRLHGQPVGEVLRALEPLIDRIAAGAHLYLWFVGD